ncbi:hypothetical protein QO004_001597 [Rhizobium mesoamericanum]|nr:hypothetical protein [Rhizobium mesoamericanum]
MPERESVFGFGKRCRPAAAKNPEPTTRRRSQERIGTAAQSVGSAAGRHAKATDVTRCFQFSPARKFVLAHFNYGARELAYKLMLRIHRLSNNAMVNHSSHSSFSSVIGRSRTRLPVA